MKKIGLILVFLCSVSLMGCMNKGDSTQYLNGSEDLANLPEHLKGLKVDYVAISDGNGIYIATLPNAKTMSLEYSQGKTSENVIVILPNDTKQRVINAKTILLENDSVILISKK
jgi:hypothetical protein